jgi:sortase A
MKRISTWLIIIGIIIILVPIVGSFYTSWQQDRLYEEYLKSQEVKSSISDLDNAFNESTSAAALTAGSITASAVTEPAVPKYKPTVIGRIKIPSVSINLILVEGTTSKDLNWGAGHLTATSMPGETGNCAIAGHRNYTFGSYFSRLGEVKLGDKITIEYNKNKYTYEVYDIYAVEPDDSSVLGQPAEGSMVTLITCHPKGSNTQRLIICAKLVS